MIHRFKVRAEHAAKRLDTSITETIGEITRSQIKSLIARQHVTVDGKVATKAGLLLQTGQEIVLTIPAPRKLDLTPQEVDIKILYEDDQLAVLEKAAGISVHPSTTEKNATVVHGLLFKLKSLSSVGGVERPGIVHRIDKGTSGILVVSKTDATHLDLSGQFKAHTIERRYRALVYGDLGAKTSSTAGRIETFYGRNPVNRKKMTGKLTEGRKAITHWRILAEGGGLSLVECRLETGRTHQIRVHLSELGFPIVGDQLYGENERKARALKRKALALACTAVKHQLLHACFLGFQHPVDEKKMEFESEVPADFANVLELMQKQEQ